MLMCAVVLFTRTDIKCIKTRASLLLQQIHNKCTRYKVKSHEVR